MKAVDQAHRQLVYGRRVRVLGKRLAGVLEPRARVLDVGAGDGVIDSLILAQRPDLQFEGIDVLLRPNSAIEVRQFDGSRIPYTDNSFDVVMFVDVLHHTEDPSALLREAKRVSSRWIVIKDHTRNGMLAGATLRFMDWVGNAHHGVALPYNYWPEERWRTAIADLGLKSEVWNTRLGLYPFPANLVFERKLHFVARLSK